MRYYVSTSRGINRESLPFKLYEKSKKFGTWDPRNIDFSRDKADWPFLFEEAKHADFFSLALQNIGIEGG